MPQAPGHSLEYRLEEGRWKLYTGPFFLWWSGALSYRSDMDWVRAQVESAGPDLYTALHVVVAAMGVDFLSSMPGWILATLAVALLLVAIFVFYRKRGARS